MSISSVFNEDSFENSILQLLAGLNYNILQGYDIERDYHNPLYMDEFESSLYSINKDANPEAVQVAIEKLQNIDIGSLEEMNDTFMHYLQNGVSVTYLENNEEASTLIKLIDYENVENNTFTAINQWTVIDKENKRPDIVIFVNGIPLVVVELKSPSREETDVSEAYTQLKKYMKVIPSLFVYNAFCIMSDQATSKAGTITSSENRFMEWKTTDGSYENTRFASFDVLFEGIFEKNRFLDILENFTLFSKEASKYIKVLAGYHQYFAVNKAVSSTLNAIKEDGKAGVFWHTQGSGKSLSMVFYVNKLQKVLSHPTFVVVTDRNDLDEQLYSQFVKCSDFLKQAPKQAESMDNLRELLENRRANGIFFTTIQKFEDYDKPLSERKDIIVISDEAHRSQYGLDEKVNAETGKIKIGAARKIRNALPNATYIGFTGTPLMKSDKSTREVFGNYIDIYDMTQSVEDGATVPIYYESRVIKLKLNESILREIDDKYGELSKNADEYNIEKSKRELSKMEELLGSPETIDSLANDIITHYEDNREFEVTGKALIVAYSRKIAMKLYRRILELRPTWQDKLNIIMTSSNKDPEDWHDVIGTKSHQKQLARRFKDDKDPFKIAIVVDMWLTGFDVPSLSTMYVYKPMSGHNLMQAIARVNRVFQGKEGGLIVDYIGISQALKQAMSDYTERDKKNYGDMDIANVAYPKFLEKLEICRDLMYGFDYTDFFGENDLKRAKSISGGVNFLENPIREESKESFLREALLLKQSASLCRSIISEHDRFESAFFESVRTLLTRITSNKKLSFKEINAAINELLKHSIKSEGIVNIVDSDEEISIFDPDFLKKISQMGEKNLAIQMLEKLINEEVRVFKRTNIVKSEEFSNMLKKTMNQYLNGHITNEEVIEELKRLAEEIKDAKEKPNELNLTAEEMAFYDAITKPENIKDFYENDELIRMTQELTESLNRNKTIDWTKKESSRANMRRIVKRLLKKYDYPPESIKDAMDIVLEQCELWADNAVY